MKVNGGKSVALSTGVMCMRKMVVCLDGKAKKAKEVVEAVDPDKNLITFRVIEGELMVCSHDSSFAQERG
ncbi:hypothetical protein Gohar_021254 [Gossypium harknessii]|uniref:Bet v I/Major latex protein domain-containing protein n=1 Tax=Gossypium harknessii TaxID=34285 RepID=A0A7J9IF38_9ROSI|nr:hypothetical protein [Gossypium harknessii]